MVTRALCTSRREEKVIMGGKRPVVNTGKYKRTSEDAGKAALVVFGDDRKYFVCSSLKQS